MRIEIRARRGVPVGDDDLHVSLITDEEVVDAAEGWRVDRHRRPIEFRRATSIACVEEAIIRAYRQAALHPAAAS